MQPSASPMATGSLPLQCTLWYQEAAAIARLWVSTWTRPVFTHSQIRPCRPQAWRAVLRGIGFKWECAGSDARRCYVTYRRTCTVAQVRVRWRSACPGLAPAAGAEAAAEGPAPTQESAQPPAECSIRGGAGGAATTARRRQEREQALLEGLSTLLSQFSQSEETASPQRAQPADLCEEAPWRVVSRRRSRQARAPAPPDAQPAADPTPAPKARPPPPPRRETQQARAAHAAHDVTPGKGRLMRAAQNSPHGPSSADGPSTSCAGQDDSPRSLLDMLVDVLNRYAGGSNLGGLVTELQTIVREQLAARQGQGTVSGRSTATARSKPSRPSPNTRQPNQDRPAGRPPRRPGGATGTLCAETGHASRSPRGPGGGRSVSGRGRGVPLGPRGRASGRGGCERGPPTWRQCGPPSNHPAAGTGRPAGVCATAHAHDGGTAPHAMVGAVAAGATGTASGARAEGRPAAARCSHEDGEDHRARGLPAGVG